jgi:hypothetical protein
MKKCKWCQLEFELAKPWQEFHDPKCRDSWHYHQKKLGAVRRADARVRVRADAAQRIRDHVNGGGHELGPERDWPEPPPAREPMPTLPRRRLV